MTFKEPFLYLTVLAHSDLKIKLVVNFKQQPVRRQKEVVNMFGEREERRIDDDEDFALELGQGSMNDKKNKLQK